MGLGITRRRLLAMSAATLYAGAARAVGPAEVPVPPLRPDYVPPKPKQLYEKMIEEARLDGKTGFLVMDAGSGEVLEEHNAHVGLPPASVAKAVTALYAMDNLGVDHLFETKVLGTGYLDGGVLQGDLILCGGGDPELTTDGLGYLSKQLVELGVTSITGRLLVWGNALPFNERIDKNQPEHVAYNPAVSGIMLNRNRVRFEWTRISGGYNLNLDARSGRYNADVTIAKISAKERMGKVYTYEDLGGTDGWTVAKAALGKGGARWLPTRQPVAYAGEVFRSVAAQNGLELPAAEVIEALPTDSFIMARRESPAMTNILKDMLKYSYNLTAEAMGMAASAKRLGRPVSMLESAKEMNRWARERFGVIGIEMIDHSGLGDRSRIAPGDLARLLATPWSKETLVPLVKMKAVAAGGGTVKKWVKTGTLHYASGLAGLLEIPDGRILSFAIFSVDFDRRTRADLKGSERPPGSKSWAQRARYLQSRLISHWA
jgi:serine-type D-Ala-D-Ala carboxypeptidase/endopeptidase (penicillin-binding protein 4)